MTGSDESPAQRFDISARPDPAAVDQLRAQEFEPFLRSRRSAIVLGSRLSALDDSFNESVPQPRPGVMSPTKLRRQEERATGFADFRQRRLALPRHHEDVATRE